MEFEPGGTPGHDRPIEKIGETLVCRLMPSGRIDVRAGSPEDGPRLATRTAQQIIEAFNDGRGKGVLHLGAAELLTDLPPPLSYWRDFGRVFVSRVCGALDPADPQSLVVPDPDPDEFDSAVGGSLLVGGGVRVPIRPDMALRFDTRGYVTFTETELKGVCGGVGCTIDFSGSGRFQVELSAGLVFEF